MIVDEIVNHLAAAWIVAAIVLGMAELAIPGVFLIFLAIAAAITGLALFVLPDLPLIAQAGSFAAWSIVAVTIGRRWYRDYPLETTDPMLNDRAARIIGTIVIIAEPIIDGSGRAILGDGTWPASGPDTAAGTHMRVIAVENGVLRVEPLGSALSEQLARKPR
ncbi:NfeD family protein [uncultured Sphingomonas sp.]|uniref:NfeD family protein n=1 Tax=uncultured Sphingomonas sp. TaxID=158754 RepID=UPI0026399C17|nr:NfeD family protein [uncultured Sphingomonas sp.]